MQRCQGQAAQARGLDRLRVHHVFALCTEPDQVARIGEAHDLAPTVGQDLVESYGAGLYAEHMRGRVALDEHELLGLDATQRGLREGLIEACHRAGGDGGLKGERLHGSGSLRMRYVQ